LTRETGKPLRESSDCIAAVASAFENSAEDAESVGEPPSGAERTGVVAAITPFNLPLLTMAASVAPAIAAGHTLVCKPPPQNPLSSLKLGEVFDLLPPGVVNIITGGPDTGHALCIHPDVEQVRFTGSAAVAARVEAQVRGKRVDLASGSLDVFIVCEDADLEVAVPGIAWARLMNAGQVGISGKHMYVERSIAAQFVERMHHCVGFLDVDDPGRASTDLGPLISREAARRVEDQVGRALRAGATLILGGRRFRPSGLAGHFFQPTLLTDVRPGSAPTREEILGPVITITPVRDLAQAIRWTVESAPGIGASIYSRDAQAVVRALAQVRAGRFRINDPAMGNAGPFGGLRHRGIRRALGIREADAIRGPQLEVAERLEQKAWWFPYGA
jgi:betaine-aldehyde dehydrogenase